MKFASKLKVALDCSVVQSSLAYDYPAFVPALVLGGWNRAHRRLVSANYLALSGDLDRAGRMLSQTILAHPNFRPAITSLGSYLSQLDWQNCQYAWNQLSPLWKDINCPARLNSGNFPLYALGAELALICEPELAEKSINDVYLDFIWKHERIDRTEHSPILYWHIPKTGGTSVNTRLSRLWYASGTEFLPSYTTRRFFNYVLNNHKGTLPYISTAHLSSGSIDRDAIKTYRKLLVLRDPEQRALSAWRQYRENPSARLRILPQHGFVWDFFPVLEYADWLKNAPSEVINPLSWTFSDYASESYADAVDEVIPIDELDHFGPAFIRRLGAQVNDGDFRVSKNVTNKNIEQGTVDHEDAKKSLAPDYEVFHQMKSKVAKGSS